MSAGLLASALFAQAADAGRFTWKRDAESSALLQDNQEVWRFRHGKEDAKPAFHPLSFPGGPVLTCFRNEDHPWHRGMWFSWKFINGLNYWEEDKVTGESEGRTEWRNAKVDTRPDFTARITMGLSYRPTNGQPVLAEQRMIEVSRPDEQGVYHIDWTMTFTALKEVLLDRTPIPGEPEGKGHGGYAGLSVRFARELTNIQVMADSGPIVLTNGTYRGKALAADYSGTLEDREIGIAFLDAPGNLNSPSPWWIIDLKAMKYFSPAVLCFQPHTLKGGQAMTLRYRALVHPGRWDAGRLRRESEQYARTVSSAKPPPAK
jgi:hypothetical protein